jgi:cytochrome c oxidase cbb3-type subunit 3
MQTRLATLIAICAALSLSACDRPAGDVAPAGAVTGALEPIGPQPGPQQPILQATNPFNANKAAMAEGFRLFQWYNCGGCHGTHAGGGMGPSLRDSTWRYGGSDAAIFASINEGRRFGMPSWGTKLPQEQLWKLVTYIKSLRTPDEPDAPGK